MSSFTTPLHVSPMSDGRNWELTRAFTFRIGSRYSNQYIRVPQGFVTDFASIPKILTLLLPSWAKFNKSPVLHDFLYRTKKIMGEAITRKQADDIFLEAMMVSWKDLPKRYFVANIEYWAVRIFAFLAWKKRSK